MQILHSLAAERGGLIPTFRLRQAGLTARRIAALRHSGALVRVRQGWYVLPGISPAVVQAVRVGGQLTCHSALEARGVWVMRDHRLHVAVDAHAVRLRSTEDARRRLEPVDGSVVVHWRRASTATTGMLADVADALADLERCCRGGDAFAVALDSALHLGLISPESEVARRHRARGIDGVCESGIETLLWLRLSRLRRQIRRQVRIRGIGRVDFLIGARLVVEVDGEQFHDSESTFERDRRRDALLALLGFRVLRFSYEQVVSDWPLVERTIRAVMAQGEHRARRRSKPSTFASQMTENRGLQGL